MLKLAKFGIPCAIAFLLLSQALFAGNKVMARLEFDGKTKVEKTSGVWVDGGYVGYVKELKGVNQVLLLPGEHTITVRQDGYQDFVQRIYVQPGGKYGIHVVMAKAPTGTMPKVTSTVKLTVKPTRAAVFVDGLFVGHVAEFEGLGRGMLVSPGSHRIKISLPGYQSFETEINPSPKQTVEVKTNLLKVGKNGEASESAVVPSRPATRAPEPLPPPQTANRGQSPQSPAAQQPPAQQLPAAEQRSPSQQQSLLPQRPETQTQPHLQEQPTAIPPPDPLPPQ